MILVLILVLGVFNFLFRFLPAILVNRFSLPQSVEDWLSYVPVATMAAIVVPTLVGGDGKAVYLSLANYNLIAALPTGLVAWKTRNLGLTLTIGMMTMALLQFFKP